MDEFKAGENIKIGQAVYLDSDGTLFSRASIPSALGIVMAPRSRVGRLAQHTRLTRWLYWRLTGRKLYVRVGG